MTTKAQIALPIDVLHGEGAVRSPAARAPLEDRTESSQREGGDGSPDRAAGYDWERIADDLGREGYAVLEGVLDGAECAHVIELYDRDDLFRSRVEMARHGFGRGQYQYFAYPLPALVAELRATFYPRLAPIANRWNEMLQIDVRYPDDHASFLTRCRDAGQSKPTPLVLRYEEGDYNCLHQDLYGDNVFPLQIAILLSDPERDFEGGEFVMTEQRPRMQSRPMVVPLKRGDAVVFAVHQRPAQGTRGFHRVHLRHGVSRLRRGRRHTMGIIFHDAT